MGCKASRRGGAPAARVLGPPAAAVALLLAGTCWFAADTHAADNSLDVTCTPAAPAAAPLLSVEELTAHIDHALADAWQRDGTTVAPPADDAEFLRRASLDIIGKIPSVSEVEQFLDDAAPDKRRQLVETLLNRGAYAQHFANTWRNLLLAGAAENVQSQINTPQLDMWLRLRFAVNMPYDRLVSDIVNAPIEAPQQPATPNMRSFIPSPAAFFQANEQKREMIAASTARIFLGVQVGCAQCHDHPFSDWTQRDFWSLAAFFDDPSNGIPPGGSSANAVSIPDSDIVVEPVFLDGTQPDWQTESAKRELLSQWMTSRTNPFFARAAVNRLWDHFLGRGFVHPVDDLDKANPPSHPELLDELARQFAGHGFDLNYLIRAITATRAYQLTSRASSVEDSDLSTFARMPVRRMTADQLFASIVQATGYRQQRRRAQPGVLPDLADAAAAFRARFSDSTVPRTEAETSILQALTLMNGELVSTATDLEESETLAAVADAPFLSDEERIDSLFMATLSRRPDAEERARFVEYVGRDDSPGEHKQALADVFWALLNSAEFALNH
ncbi:MAG: DUF1553 domain-containing protein [Planctomycetota bacterium]|nr:MAG: DUF1553 domain-containing protein [Planctomycetota bacterium]